MWQLIVHYEISRVLNEDVLMKEIDLLSSRHSLKSSSLFNASLPLPSSSLFHSPKSTITTTDNNPTNNNSRNILYLLFQWCLAVVVNYNVVITDWNDCSYHNGKVMSYLLHHYHPALLTMDEITNNNNTHNNNNMIMKISLLGCVPPLLSTSSIRETHGRETIITFLSYLAARLLESSDEIRATIVIQRTWRRYKVMLFTYKYIYIYI